MEILRANTALIERLLNDFDLSPRARQFVLSLRSWKDTNRVLTKNQIRALNHIEKSYLKSENIFVFKTKLFQQITFLTLNIKYLYSSTPNLNHTIFQKSKISKCKYIYLSHSPVSMNLIYNLNAFDHFDAVQVTSEYQYKEMKEIIKKRKLKTKIFIIINVARFFIF